jgi:hypothetical protein
LATGPNLAKGFIMGKIFVGEIIRYDELPPKATRTWFWLHPDLKAVYNLTVTVRLGLGTGVSGYHAEITSISHYVDNSNRHRLQFKVKNHTNKWLGYSIEMSKAIP